MAENVELQTYVDSINNSIRLIREDKKEINSVHDVPSDFRLMMYGAKDSKLLDFIYDTKLDYTIDKLMNKFMVGDFSDIEKYGEMLGKVFTAMGLGEGSFEGPVSQTMMKNILSTMNSLDFNKTQNNIKKCFMVLKNLKKQAKDINDQDIKRKYKDAVYALKQILRYISKIYGYRRIITNRVRRGFNSMVHENEEFVEALESWED